MGLLLGSAVPEDADPYLSLQEQEDIGQGLVAHARLQPLCALSCWHSNTLEAMPGDPASLLQARVGSSGV